MKPWSVKNRWRVWWLNVKLAPWRRKPARFVHNIAGPSTGCGCIFCFYSKRRKFPPGHPNHPVQIRVELAVNHSNLVALLNANYEKTQRSLRIHDENRQHPLG